MKRIFITLVAVLACVFNVNAQLVVDSLGRVGIGTETPSEMLSISGKRSGSAVMRIFHHGESRGLHINCIQSKDVNPMRGIDVTALARDGGGCIGVYSHIRNSTATLPSNASVGVYGDATGSKSNIGLLGIAPTSDTESFGAGVFGRVGGIGILPSMVNTVGSYAGYFSGPVKVTGKLYGTLYSPTGTASSALASSSKTLSSLSEDEETISDKLLSVQTIQFMREEETGRLKPSASSDKLAGKTAINNRLASDDMNADKLFDEDADPENNINIEEESPLETEMVKRYGLDGAQLKAVFPELVAEDEQGNYSINYSEMVPLLLQSIRELKAEVEELKGEKNGGAQKLNAKATSIESESESTDIVRMSQNKPNPFSESSVITLSIPEGTKSAAIYVYDLSGKQVKNIPVDKRGETDITVYASDLSEGMFVYSLVTDGTVAATRRMMVVKN